MCAIEERQSVCHSSTPPSLLPTRTSCDEEPKCSVLYLCKHSLHNSSHCEEGKA